ncbi:MAG: polysaccharide biosynthesis protein [Deltaproteobacteria bacterium]|nr:polysaccharide biosynthesis protein [Deltaproteobacteria bacterium]
MDDELVGLFKDKDILVTGGTGTVGSKLVTEMLKYEPRAVRVYSRDESKQFDMFERLNHHPKVRMLIGDVRDKPRLNYAMEDIDIVFHCAAMKHVPACEYNPFEAVRTNVIGTQHVIAAALKCNVKKVVFTGTDKAAAPTNTMGATKLLAERIISAANYYKGKRETVFTTIRFGNVMGSRGSVIPLFRDQIKRGGPVTVTNPRMTRFMMSLSQAVYLVFKATLLCKGGEVFTLKMPTLHLGDLVEALIEGLAPRYGYKPEDVAIQEVGLRPGEKMYEELLTEYDAVDALETDDLFITPSILKEYMDLDVRGLYPGAVPIEIKRYTSEDYPALSKEEIKNILKAEGFMNVNYEIVW